MEEKGRGKEGAELVQGAGKGKEVGKEKAVKKRESKEEEDQEEDRWQTWGREGGGEEDLSSGDEDVEMEIHATEALGKSSRGSRRPSLSQVPVLPCPALLCLALHCHRPVPPSS